MPLPGAASLESCQLIELNGSFTDLNKEYYFSPKSLLIAFTRPVPSSFCLPCIGRTDILLPSRTMRWPPLPGSNAQPCFCSQRLNSALVMRIDNTTNVLYYTTELLHLGPAC